MKKLILKSLFLAVPSLFMSADAWAQFLIKGQLIDAGTNDALIGATAVIDGTTVGAATDFDGFFEINSPKDGPVTLVFRNIGYTEIRKPVTVKGATTNVGTIAMEENAIGLDDVTVIASIVRSDRQTPIAVSNIQLDVLEEKMGNQEFPEILKQTPSIYATKNSGGYGDSRITLRGFDTNNIGVLVNGVPVNDMENGKVYWSNWAGLSDVTQFMQVQRGLGASKLALSSAGGTINIVTKTTEAKKGATASVGLGNDGQNRFSLALSTGLMTNGWSFTVLGARNQGNGYIQGTQYEGYTYFANISKMINEYHRLSFTAFGAPQWHNQRGIMLTEEDWKTKPGGRRFNATTGFYKGEQFGGAYGYNEYHKPQMSLNHSWNINPTSTLSTALYASISSGGGRRTQGPNARFLQWDSNTGQPFSNTMLTPEGYLDFASVVEYNKTQVKQEGISETILTSSVNRHKWFGLLTSYNNQITDHLSITAGYDGRYYRGYHYEVIDDLLGGTGYIPQNYKYQTQYLYGQEGILQVGDRTAFNNIGEVMQHGLFGQLEYSNDQLSTFISSSITYQGYRYHNIGATPIDIISGEVDVVNGRQISDWQNFLPWSTKAGFNWKFNQNHNAFVNGGYFTRAPYFNNIFKNYSIQAYDDKPYEKIMTFEGGYTVSYEKFAATIGGYYTEWLDRGKAVSTSIKQEDGTYLNGRAILRGLDARHAGIEIETTYKPVKNLELRGMFSWGDWVYTDNVSSDVFTDNQEYAGTYEAYIKGTHVGNSAQLTAALGAKWEIIEGLSIGADWNYAGKNYADFDVNNRQTADDMRDSYKIPNYYTVDVSASYRMKLNNNASISFFANGYNVLNQSYIADAKDAVVNGQNTALVYYGFGPTWSAGMKVSF